MRLLESKLRLVLALSLVFFVFQSTSQGAPISEPFPVERFAPHILGRSQVIAQRMRLSTDFAVPALYKSWFAAIPEKQKDALAQGTSYTDLLTTVEVMADAWVRGAAGRSLTDDGIAFLFCLWSFCIGGPPKSPGNAGNVTRARSRIIAGAYVSREKRAEIQRRLQPAFLGAPTLDPSSIDLQRDDIEKFVDLR